MLYCKLSRLEYFALTKYDIVRTASKLHRCPCVLRVHRPHTDTLAALSVPQTA